MKLLVFTTTSLLLIILVYGNDTNYNGNCNEEIRCANDIENIEEFQNLIEDDIFELLFLGEIDIYDCPNITEQNQCNDIEWNIDTSMIEYNFHTKSNPDNPSLFVQNNIKTISLTNFKRNKPNVFVAHGYTSRYNSKSNERLIPELLKHYDVNVFAVDWSKTAYNSHIQLNKQLSKRYDSFQAIRLWKCCSHKYVEKIGEAIGDVIYTLMQRFSIASSNFLLIGHGLAANILGQAGRRIQTLNNSLVSSIVGLDPIELHRPPQNTDLHPSHADFVHGVHVNLNDWDDVDTRVGHADYYLYYFPFPNTFQINDYLRRNELAKNAIRDVDNFTIELDAVLNHRGLVDLYAVSLSSYGFLAHQCQNRSAYGVGLCNFNPQSIVGRLYVDRTASGKYQFRNDRNSASWICETGPHCPYHNEIEQLCYSDFEKPYGLCRNYYDAEYDNQKVLYMPTDLDGFEVLFQGEDADYLCEELYAKDECNEIISNETSPTIKYFLHNRKTTSNSWNRPHELRQDSVKIIPSLTDRPNIFLAHGYLSGYDSIFNKLLISKILRNHDVNVFAVDWADEENNEFIEFNNYSYQSVNVSSITKFIQERKCCWKEYAKLIGESIGDFIHDLMLRFKMDSSKFILIGDMLGAHVQGYAGARVKSLSKSSVSTIIALDPITINSPSDEDRLSPSDAEFVHVIHGKNSKIAYGHADYYMNVSICTDLFSFFQDFVDELKNKTDLQLTFNFEEVYIHNYIIKTYADTLSSFKFIYNRCDGGENDENCQANCFNNHQAVLGRLYVDKMASGRYYLPTDCVDNLTACFLR